MTINEYCKAYGLTRAKLAAKLTETAKCIDRECQPIYEGRLYRLMSGAKPQAYELQALTELTCGEVSEFAR